MLSLAKLLATHIFSAVLSVFVLLGLHASTESPKVPLSPISQQEKPFAQVSTSTTKISSATRASKPKSTSTPSVTKKIVPESVAEETTKTTPTASAAPITIPAPIIATSTELAPLELDLKVRSALVNIICATESGGFLEPISGTGIIISPQGLIITAAHIGQYFLVKDYPKKDSIHCIARTGSPAKEMYGLELVYIPPAWVNDNFQNLTSDDPLGTGENDFALLRITSTLPGVGTPPSPLPFLEPEPNQLFIYKDENVELAGYPAGFLGALAINRDLYIASTVTTIKDFFTFRENTIDIVSLGGSVVAQKGSSGGAAVSLSGKLLGLIVTTTVADTTGARDLRAITMTHVDTRLKETTGYSLEDFRSGDIADFATGFQTSVVPNLAKKLILEIEKRN